jgi:dTDP-4-dehydrorhamnose 3,5-epimerase
MKVISTDLTGVVIIEPKVFGDSRGFFMEMFNEARYQEMGILPKFVQDNLSSSAKNVVRGLHYQLKNPQAKLVSVIKGGVMDVVVDIRLGSPQFGRSIIIELSEENKRQVYIPPGFAHGFCTITDEVIFHYKCSDYYHPEDEYGILWNDVDLNIPWPLVQAVVSEKDLRHPAFKDIPIANLPEYDPL